jgi:hypothetical protein
MNNMWRVLALNLQVVSVILFLVAILNVVICLFRFLFFGSISLELLGLVGTIAVAYGLHRAAKIARDRANIL